MEKMKIAFGAAALTISGIFFLVIIGTLFGDCAGWIGRCFSLVCFSGSSAGF